MKLKIPALIAVVFVLGVSPSISKEVKDLTDVEKSHLAAISSIACGKLPTKEQSEIFKRTQNLDAFNRMRAYFEVMDRTSGTRNTCDMLYVEGLIEK